MPKKKARGVEVKKSSRYTMVSSGMGPTLAVQATPEKQVGYAVPYEAIQSGFGDLKRALAEGDISPLSHTTETPDTPVKKPKVLKGTSVAEIVINASKNAEKSLDNLTFAMASKASLAQLEIMKKTLDAQAAMNAATIAAQEKIDEIIAPTNYSWSIPSSFIEQYDFKQPSGLIAEGHGASLSDTPPEPHREDYLDSMIEGRHRLDALEL